MARSLGRQVFWRLWSSSRFAAVVVLGFEAPDEGVEGRFFESIERIAGDLPRVLLVDSAGGMQLTS
jgi:hypothetical protein